MTYSYSANPLYVADGQSVQFRYEAPAGFDTIEQVRIDIGELTAFWIIETKLEDFAPDPFGFQNVDPADQMNYTHMQQLQILMMVLHIQEHKVIPLH